MKIKTIPAITALALLALAPACGGEDDHEEPIDPSEDACEHMIEGPVESATAIDDMSADAPDIGEHHTRFDVTLVGDQSNPGSYVGYVDLVVEETGESLIFLDADVPMQLWTAAGDEVEVEATSNAIDACTEVAISYTYDLEVGTYLMQLGSTSADQVGIVVVLAGEHDHDHDE
ncbi:hypothetical protein [Haliangium ochraceum]|uniref:Lipoprotein n=1 Tax=Haliangium ochraceum (strain DSM 14365 / JCM 11303 / SMP-2) TaxID=502025 RepID=D0LZF6_HALO1|nr:hypothetical protein [Haliangium ochraceum]ACY16418.1 conserved hypothetical protein [Haliangium ochraceum DSM 14365]